MDKFTAHSIGGVVLDKDPRSIKPNELSYANDNEILGTESGRDMSSYPLPSSKLEFELNELVAQYQYVRIKFNPSAVSYTFTIKNTSGNAIGLDVFTITVASLPSPTAANFVTAINTIVNASGYNAVLESSSGLWVEMAITLGGSNTPVGYSITQSELINGTTTVLDIFTLQEWYNPLGASQAQLMPLQSIQVNENLFVFSKTFDGQIQSIGVGTKNDNDVWTYTSLIESRNLDFPSDQVIEIQVEEVNNGQYAFYWVTNTGKPKTIYIPTDLSTPLRYNAFYLNTPSPSGLFTLESIVEQTNTQIQNFGIVKYENQLQSGGNLEAGTWFYFVQSGINRNYSEWSAPSDPIPVFTQTTQSQSAGAIIAGDKTPVITGKANQIRISGVDSKVYDTVRVAAMVNQGGAFSAVIVGEYDVVVSGNDFIVTHTGLEQSIEVYDIAFLPPVQEVLTNAKNVQIKKNRINYANIEIQVEEDLDEIFANISLGQDRVAIDSIGTVTFQSEPFFRAGLNNSYSLNLIGQQAIAFQNDSTNGNFDNVGAFNLTTGIFTVPIGGTGTYNLSISHSFGFPSEIGLYPKEVYILNQTNGARYCLNTNSTPSRARFPVLNNKQTVSLTAGDTLVCAVFNERETGSGGYQVVQFTWNVDKAISDYPTKTLRVGEYELPDSVATKTGYMVNENYAFYARVKYNSGYLSKWRYIGQHNFAGNTFPANALELDLTNNTFSDKIFAYGLTIDGLNVTNFKDEISYIEIGRAICNPTILGSGMFIASDSKTGGSGGTFTAGLYTTNTGAFSYRSENSLANDNRYFGAMLCPDWATGEIKPQFQEGDKLIVWGSPFGVVSQTITGGSNKFAGYWEYSGVFTGNGVSYMIDIADAAYTEFATNSRVLRNDVANLFLAASVSNDGTKTTLAAECMAMALESKIVPLPTTLASLDNGAYYVQYYRPNANQYNIVDSTVVSCNYFIEVDKSSDNTLPQQLVFGGDTYTQKTYMKVMYNANNPVAITGTSALVSFLGFYSQNKINQQMRFVDKNFTNQPFPFNNTLDNYLFGVYDANEQFQIDAGYTWYAPLFDERPYNPKIPRQSKFKSRIVYSQQKVLNSLQDTYRVLLPNDFKDLDAKNGEINGLYDINDIMVALQPFKVNVLPYQSDVGLSAQDGSLFVGSGGVYAQRENPISSYGATIKSGTLVAENEAGNSLLYWYSENGRGLFRYGNDGVKNLSNENSWRTWFFNNTNLIKSEFDIVMGFDRTRSAVFTTARAFNEDIAAWNSGTAYTAGQVVKYAPTNNQYQNFERLPDFYLSKGNNTNVNPYINTTTGGSTFWEYIPTTDLRYYNYWSAIYNEKFNFFQGFFSLIPSRYFYYNGEIFLPRGIAPFDNMFNLFGGSGHLQWLSVSGEYKQGNFILEWVSNSGGFIPCRYKKVGLIVGTNHTDNPTLLVYNENQTSLSVGDSEFAYLNGQISQGILPDINDDPITSEYVKVRLSNTSFYRAFGAVVGFYQRARTLFK